MNNQYDGCFSKILFSYTEIKKRIKELANEINSCYKSIENDEVIVLGVLDGSFVFCGHILPYLNFNIIFKTAKISMYGNKTYADENDMLMDFNFDAQIVKNKRILILEDLLDTGLTLKKLKDKLIEIGAKEVKICVLFRKKLNNKMQIDVDWYGYDIPNDWVAGFGIDSRGKYRNFKHLGVLKIEKR